jgi:hypothetical protein
MRYLPFEGAGAISRWPVRPLFFILAKMKAKDVMLFTAMELEASTFSIVKDASRTTNTNAFGNPDVGK